MPCCKNCSDEFTVDSAEADLRRRLAPSIGGTISPVTIEIPQPTLCPSCRMQRRMLWRGELNWYRRNSDLSGKPLVTYLPETAKCKVYSLDEWWSDGWDGLDFGREFDFNRPFFEQFAELIRVVPLPALNNYQNENCEYINCAASCRNCYLLGGTNYAEDCYYGNYVNHSKNCVDNNFISNCELAYECIDCKGCYDLKYSQNCENCSQSAFLFNCRGCADCFGCCDLNRKQFHFYNQPLSREEYFKQLAAIGLESRSGVEKARTEFEKFRSGFPNRFMIGIQNENVTGNAINNSKDCAACFDASGLDDCRNSAWLHNAKSCMDIFSWGMTAELCYECTEVGSDSYQVLFSATTWGSSRLLYCYLSRQCQDCFGCMSLNRKQFCILNKQYSETEYHRQVSLIVSHMQKTGEWGEFFPMSLSPQPYNSAVTQDYYPLDQKAVEKLGAYWYQQPDSPPDQAAGEKTRSRTAGPVPETADLLQAGTYSCAATGKLFRITSQELDFYRRQKIAPPALSFPERHRRRLAQRNPRRLWDRKCDRCRKELKTSYKPGRPERIFCEECFLVEAD